MNDGRGYLTEKKVVALLQSNRRPDITKKEVLASSLGVTSGAVRKWFRERQQLAPHRVIDILKLFDVPEEKLALSDQEFRNWCIGEELSRRQAIQSYDVNNSGRMVAQQISKDVATTNDAVTYETVQSYLLEANPYKYLEYYDVTDTDYFFGRKASVDAVLQNLSRGFSSNEFQPIVRIMGASGCGKSSLLRAGVLGALKRQSEVNCEFIVFRPTDLHDKTGKPNQIIEHLLSFIDQHTKIKISSSSVLNVCANARPAASAVQLIETLLQDGGDNLNLAIGLDQFEEVVDDLLDPSYATTWHPLKDFINECSRSKRIGLVFTLENSRDAQFKECGLSRAISYSQKVPIDGFNYDFLREIIEEPFKKAKIPLSPETVQQLIDQADTFRLTRGANDEGSLLPLFSIKLYRLFELAKGEATRSNIENFVKASSNSFNLDPSLDEHDIDLGMEINNLANRAWQQVMLTPAVDLHDVHAFLLGIVRMAGVNSEKILLGTFTEADFDKNSLEYLLVKTFKRFHLIVPVEHNREAGRLRLVHEVVIRYWLPANNWFNQRVRYLKMEAIYRNRAMEWAALAYPSLDFTILDSIATLTIANAAEILDAHRRIWFAGEASITDDNERALFKYCRALFIQNDTPENAVSSTRGGWHYIHIAAIYSELDLIKRYASISFNSLNFGAGLYDTSLIHAAVFSRKTDVLEFLLNSNCDPFVCNEDLSIPLAWAVDVNSLESFKLLLPLHKIKNNFLCCERIKSSQFNILHFCAQKNRLDMIKILVEEKYLDPSTPDEYKMNSLHHAADCGSLASFQYLAKQPGINIAAKDMIENSCLHFAASNGHLNIVRELLTHFSEFIGREDEQNSNGHSALMLASINQRPDVIRCLAPFVNINLKVNQSAEPMGSTALHLAIQNCGKSYFDQIIGANVVNALLQDGNADPNLLNDKGLSLLALAKDKPILLDVLLHAEQLDPDLPIHSPERDTALAICLKQRKWMAFDLLSKRSNRMKFERIDSNGNTILHLLARYNAPPTLLLTNLVQSEDCVNVMNNFHCSPIMEAIDECHWPIVTQLLNCENIKPGLFNPGGKCALALALDNNAPEDILQRLWEDNPEQLAFRGVNLETPLHVAAIKNNIKNIDWIKNHSVDFNLLCSLRDAYGRRAIDVASSLAIKHLPTNVDDSLLTEPKTWGSSLNWQEFDSINRQLLVDHINPIERKYRISEKTRIQHAALPYYNAEVVRIVSVHDNDWVNGTTLYFLYEIDVGLQLLNGTSPPLHNINQKWLLIDASNVLDYLRFFCFFVRVENNPFLIVESISQITLPETINRNDVNRIKALVVPSRAKLFLPPAAPDQQAQSKPENDKSLSYIAWSYVWSSHNLYFSSFRIHETGTISMERDIPLMTNLPRIKHTPLD